MSSLGKQRAARSAKGHTGSTCCTPWMTTGCSGSCQGHEALHAQELGLRRAQKVEEHVERALADRLVAREAEGADALVVPVHVVMVMIVAVMMVMVPVLVGMALALGLLHGLRLQPFGYIGDLAVEAEETAGDERRLAHPRPEDDAPGLSCRSLSAQAAKTARSSN